MTKPLTHLRELRESAQLTQVELSAESGVSVTRLVCIETTTDADEIERIKLSTLLRLARCLKVKARDIYPDPLL